MTEYKIDVSSEPDYMKGYHLVKSIYNIRDIYLFPEEGDSIVYDKLVVNKTILNIIDEINFIYVKDNETDENSIRKVGNLLNFKVYLDSSSDNVIKMFAKGEKMILINVIL